MRGEERREGTGYELIGSEREEKEGRQNNKCRSLRNKGIRTLLMKTKVTAKIMTVIIMTLKK